MSTFTTWILPRADTAATSSSVQGFHFQQNSTSAAINELKFDAAKQVRSSFIVLASFNTAVAFATAVGIFWESYKTTKRNNFPRPARTPWLHLIGPAEAYPFILSCAIVAQGVVFAVVQSRGLEGLLILGCAIPSQVTLPALFFVPYTQLVFAVETTVRAFNKRSFLARGRWNMTICLVVIGLGVLATGVLTIFIRPANFCFAFLFWFLRRWSLGCFGLLIAITAILLTCGGLIFFKLYTNMRIDITQRIAASWMVYFIAIGVISNALYIPFFYSLSFEDPRTSQSSAMELSMVAGVVANLSGIMTGGLYLFLRASRMAVIGPTTMDSPGMQDMKNPLRTSTPSNCDYNYHINQPISPPRRLRKSDSKEILIEKNEDEEQRVESPKGSPTSVYPQEFNFEFDDIIASSLPKIPDPAQISPDLMPKALKTNSTYQGGPNTAVEPQTPAFLLPTTTYAPPPPIQADAIYPAEGLLLPPPIHESRHKRDSSMVSSATVQIGLRFSNVEDVPPLNSAYIRDSTHIHALAFAAQPQESNPRKPSPLVTSMVNTSNGASQHRNRSQPSTPIEDDVSEIITLSPDVYIPQSKPRLKITSPRGVGYSPPSSRANSPEGTVSPFAEREMKRQDWI